MTALLSADVAISVVSQIVAKLPVYIAGSAAASAMPGAPNAYAYDDIDLWFPSPLALVAGAERLKAAGFVVEDRHARVYERWMKQGMSRKWHTHSLKLTNAQGIIANCVFKSVDGHPATSAAQVIESFDFGLLGVAYDCELMDWRDMRDYLFPGMSKTGPLPLLPLRRELWVGGFISQYQGLREVGRYVKYLDYGWDLSLIKDDLVTGYLAASRFHEKRETGSTIGKIFETIGLEIDADKIDSLREASKEILFMDDLDKIMEALD